MTKYKLELNEEQLVTLERALDLYYRIGLGQFHEILNWQFNWDLKDLPYSATEWMRDRLDDIKRMLTGFPANAYRGIFGEDTPERCKIACDIQQVARHCRSWHNNPEGGITVNYNEPMRSSEQPLPKCEVVK